MANRSLSTFIKNKVREENFFLKKSIAKCFCSPRATAPPIKPIQRTIWRKNMSAQGNPKENRSLRSNWTNEKTTKMAKSNTNKICSILRKKFRICLKRVTENLATLFLFWKVILCYRDAPLKKPLLFSQYRNIPPVV